MKPSIVEADAASNDFGPVPGALAVGDAQTNEFPAAHALVATVLPVAHPTCIGSRLAHAAIQRKRYADVQ